MDLSDKILTLVSVIADYQHAIAVEHAQAEYWRGECERLRDQIDGGGKEDEHD